MPPSGITGATFIDGRMYVAGQGGGPFRVYSIDLATGAHRLEIERRIVGESEGLVTASVKGGTLHWLIQPFNAGAAPAHLRPRPRDAAELRPGRRRRPARAAAAGPPCGCCAARGPPSCAGAASLPPCAVRRAAPRGSPSRAGAACSRARPSAPVPRAAVRRARSSG